jgi:pimeloyl-ACP methyl ester carboxylesterase
MSGKDVTVVLAHAAWIDGSSWSRVIDRLRSEGRRSIAAPLPLTTFADDVAALNRVIDRIDGQVVLVGHAYSGAMIGATRSEKVKALVYVNALVPDEGETVMDVFTRTKPHALAPQLVPDTDGWLWLPEDAFARAFAQQAPEREQVVLAAVQRPISLSCITVPVGRPAWHEKPSWYLIAEEDRMIPVENQRFMAERIGAQVVTYPLDHLPMLGAPELVAELILSAVKA